jgi:hypothetical protein
VSWLILIIPTLVKLRQEDHEFKNNLPQKHSVHVYVPYICRKVMGIKTPCDIAHGKLAGKRYQLELISAEGWGVVQVVEHPSASVRP